MTLSNHFCALLGTILSLLLMSKLALVKAATCGIVACTVKTGCVNQPIDATGGCTWCSTYTYEIVLTHNAV